MIPPGPPELDSRKAAEHAWNSSNSRDPRACRLEVERATHGVRRPARLSGSLHRFLCRALPGDLSDPGGGGSGARTYIWDFGDNATDTAQNPVHTYPGAGIYQATVQVTDMLSEEVCRDTALVMVGIIADPLCSAGASTRWGDAPLTVDLSAIPVFSCGPEPYTWSWRLGDGGASTDQLPQHVYAVGGTFWAVATLHTATHSCDCYPVLRITALGPDVSGVGPVAPGGELRIAPAYPNPFGALTTITYDLPRSGPTRLTVVDVSGRVVAELVNEFRPAGRATSVWQGHTTTGRQAPAGLYVARLEHDGVVKTTQIIRVR